jgi:protein-L-isoaspartate(D-aspartate) O-methyltransferase
MKDGYLKTDSVIEAFSEINRMDFLPPELESEARSDVALPIGYGQTISQPATISTMLELLSAQKGQNILDIGSGSGWTTALLANIAGEDGKVTAVERIKELAEWGKNNVDKYKYFEKGLVEFYVADGKLGWLENAPYDRILVSAAASEIPTELKKQLKVGGKMVIPVGDSLIYLEKKSEDDFYEEKYPGFAFVPLI